MATVLAEPDAAKAVTAGDVPDMIHFGFPITKSEDTEQVNPVDGTPDLMIWGKVTDGTVDSDLQIVDPEASLRWIKTWYDTKANIRLGHDPKRPIGRGIDIDGHHVKALIADPTAKHLIRSKVLQDWSVGIMNPDIRKGDPRFRHLDPMGKAVNGVITDRDDGLTGLGEISAVDRGSNYGTAFRMVKAAAGGALEWVGKVSAPDELLSEAAGGGKAARSYRTVSVDLPASMRIKVSPAQLAKMNTMARRNAVPATSVTKAVTVGESGPGLVSMEPAKAAAADADGLAAFKAAGDAEEAFLGKGSRTFTAGQRREHASAGTALPDGTYPMPDADAVRRAAILIRSKHGNWKAAAKLLAKRVKALGIPNPLKKPKAGKVAAGDAPDVPKAMKCAKCTGKGMADGKPCTECPKGAKRAKKLLAKAVAGPAGPAAPAAAKKKKAMCTGCGARQNRKHAMCSECGHPMDSAIPVMKNHDFTCLGCGNTPLDKGEPHCPQCGKENPGYLEVADRKLPMNDGAKAARERVGKSSKRKGGKKKKKGMKDGKEPFGGSQAKPFGAKDEDGEAKKSAKPETVKRKKGRKGGKGRSPAVGAVSQPTEGLPPHREPDGPAVEAFESGTAMADGDERSEMAAAMRHKSLALEPHLADLHDLTCPAFAPADVAKALPAASFAAIDTGYWQSKALDAASGADFTRAQREWNAYAALTRHALALKTADLQVLHDLRAEHHMAFLEANKAFRDATPGPGSFPTPGHVTPGRFSRPYISAGHAAASPQHHGPNSFSEPEGTPVATDYSRDYLTAGRATDSPSNDTPRPMPQPAPVEAGNPSHVFYQDTMRDNARQALNAMHDHVSRLFPDVCPMSPEMGHAQKPAPAVPEPVGMTMPHRAKAAKAKAGKAAKVKTPVKKRKADRPAPALVKAFQAAQAAPETPAAAPDADAITAAVRAATAPLARQMKAQDKALRKNARVLDAIAGQRDTSGAPSRLAGVAKTTMTSAAPAGPRTASESAEQAQTAKMRRLWDTWRSTSIPEFQEAAWQELQAMLGTQPLTGNDNGLVPMRRPPQT